jgi:hypothetical protein
VSTLPGDRGAGPSPLVMSIDLADGRRIERRADVVKGSIERPLSAAEAAEKLTRASSGLLDADALRNLEAAVHGLADGGLAPLTAILRTAGPDCVPTRARAARTEMDTA